MSPVAIANIYTALDSLEDERRDYIIDKLPSVLMNMGQSALGREFRLIFGQYLEEHPRMITCNSCGEYAEDSGDGSCNKCRAWCEGMMFGSR